MKKEYIIPIIGTIVIIFMFVWDLYGAILMHNEEQAEIQSFIDNCLQAKGHLTQIGDKVKYLDCEYKK